MLTISSTQLINWVNSKDCPLKRKFISEYLDITGSYLCTILKGKKPLGSKNSKKLTVLYISTKNYLLDLQGVKHN